MLKMFSGVKHCTHCGGDKTVRYERRKVKLVKCLLTQLSLACLCYVRDCRYSNARLLKMM